MKEQKIIVTTPEELERLIEAATLRVVKAYFKQLDSTLLPSEEYISKSKAARLINVSTSTIDNYVRQGKLNEYPFTGKTVRFKREEVLRLTNGR